MSLTHVRRGFTLMELLLIIGIITLLVGMILARLNPKKWTLQTLDRKRSSHASELESALYQFSWDKGYFPGSGNILSGVANAKPVCLTGYNTSNTSTSCVNVDLVVPTYIPSIPVDEANPCANYTGFQIYLQQGHAIVQPMYSGVYPGDLTTCTLP